ncbi:hypothetical protein QFC24_005613 [Naganishia onofrii]|uniref:Uncharacterized protein n=1 Tax=Naganishia onofrii TaxID=1851511 RepID=A0ACC2X8H3_9TREE|nr:hypothetical protein QFC24_005613 [Naganishia onofrii]
MRTALLAKYETLDAANEADDEGYDDYHRAMCHLGRARQIEVQKLTKARRESLLEEATDGSWEEEDADEHDDDVDVATGGLENGVSAPTYVEDTLGEYTNGDLDTGPTNRIFQSIPKEDLPSPGSLLAVFARSLQGDTSDVMPHPSSMLLAHLVREELENRSSLRQSILSRLCDDSALRPPARFVAVVDERSSAKVCPCCWLTSDCKVDEAMSSASSESLLITCSLVHSYATRRGDCIQAPSQQPLPRLSTGRAGIVFRDVPLQLGLAFED